MAEARSRLLRRRLLLLRWARHTSEEAQGLGRDLDPAYPVTQQLQHVAKLCAELQELLNRPTEL